MRAVFVQRGCPFCKEVIEAVNRLNTLLPLYEKIPIVYIESGDSRVNFLRNIFGDTSRTPCLVIDNEILMARFGRYFKTRSGNIFVFSVLEKDHMFYLLKNLQKRRYV